jgi:hypothetical protein
LKRINKERILRICTLIVHRLGKSKYKKDSPKILLLSNEKDGGSVFGEYTNYNNEIKIWWKSHSTSKDIALTLIHEYAHYLQFWPWYIRYMKSYPYEKNPYELEAIKISELFEPEISRLSSDQEWQKLLHKDKKLQCIYSEIIEKVEIAT